MRTVTTLTTRQLATALAKREDGSNPNVAPSEVRVNTITERLGDVVAKHNEITPGYDAGALTTTQAEHVQTAYLQRVQNGVYAADDAALVSL